MGHHWTDAYSDEQLAARDRDIKRFTDAKDLGYKNLEFSITGRVEGHMCPRCGAIVAIDGVQLHEDFHEMIGRAARQADSADSIWRPIGGRHA